MAVEMPALSQFSGYKVSRRKRSISQKGFPRSSAKSARHLLAP